MIPRRSLYTIISTRGRVLSSRRHVISKQFPKSFSSISNSSSNLDEKYDRLLVVGSGVAGSAAALIAAETYKIPVTILFAGKAPTDCNSYWAQGGIIYRNYNPDSGDSASLLAQDIHNAGAGLCDNDAVQKVANEGPERVRQLLLAANNSTAFANVPFDRCTKTGELSLCLEASHAAPRILHKADHTGKVITEHITAAAAKHPLITLQSETVVTDLIIENGICIGVNTLKNNSNNIQKQEYASYGTVLASGGLAGIYEHSTNPAGFNALGSSVAIAARANVITKDLEYVQFHPTALCLPGQARFLLTEALRGEGAILRDANGRAFAKDYHKAGELAPRDIVARAVFAESQKSVYEHNAFLDISHRDSEWLYNRFPTIHEHLRTNSTLDLGTDPLPIIPAAHYTCGGIATDLNGCTNILGCYAAGEAARTGLHGGNRLASTSLLEGLVFGASVADHAAITKHQSIEASKIIKSIQKENNNQYTTTTTNTQQPDKETAITLLRRLRRVMWDHVGVIRTVSGLNTAITTLEELKDSAEELHEQSPSYETAAVRDATCSGYAVAQAALANPKSAGAHCLITEEAATSDSDSDDEDTVVMAAAAR